MTRNALDDPKSSAVFCERGGSRLHEMYPKAGLTLGDFVRR